MQQEIKYFTVPTIRGLEKIEQYYRTNKVIKLTHMGLGGGNGYTAPDPTAIVVPNEWVKLALERHPKSGFIGGGLTIENSIDEFKGKIIENVGIYDEDSELILIAAYRPIVIDPEDSIISAYTINIRALLSNAEHVTVITDTSITHPTIDDMNAAIGDLHEELSKYATTEKSGLIELATQQEVSAGIDDKRAVTPSTLKHELDAIKGSIDNQGTELSKYATTESAGLIEIATQEEVDASSDEERAITPKTLDKQGLITSLQQFATQKAEDVKQFILGGVPSSSLDTILEIDKALQQTGDAIRAVYDTIATKLSVTAFEQYKTDIANKLSVINQNIANLAPRVTVFNGRHATFTIPNIKGSVVTFTLQSQRDSNINNPKLGSTAECTFILIGSNQIERIGYWFVQQSRTQFSEFIVSAEILRNNVIFTVEQQFYNSNSNHEPTTPSFTSTACHFKDIVVRV
ncbi:phage tail protein [Photobacterium damselae]|uniref:phage tail-collar fiber domain-containing protein n=1 Tax=Photobacterium damselae TaxID=38293 RepID=UPI004067E9DE